MTPLRCVLCAILLGTAAGCGGKTNAETIQPPQQAADYPAAVNGAPRSLTDADTDTTPAVSSAAADTSADEATLEVDTSESTTHDNTPSDEQASVVEVAPVDVELTPRTVLDGALTLDVPADFHVMSHSSREKKYPAGHRPTFVLTNATEDVNIAFNLTQNAMTPQQLPNFQRQMSSLFRAQVGPDGWLGSQTIRLNGLDWFTIEMRTDAPESAVWNLIAGTSVNNQLLLVSFNATEEHEAKWAPAGHQMLQTLRINAELATQLEISQAP